VGEPRDYHPSALLQHKLLSNCFKLAFPEEFDVGTTPALGLELVYTLTEQLRGIIALRARQAPNSP
jgi:hypothetical protein